MTDLPDIDVVITHYNAERDLQLVLKALAAQTYPVQRLRIVVTDDGSQQLPTVPDGLELVTQPDEGFRAARARNRGAALGSAEFILFLDGDTVPSPEYCVELVRAMRENGSPRGVVGVGQRRYANFEGIADDAVLRFVSGESPNDVQVFDDATWLSHGYERTQNLTRATGEDWRYVISAVMGVSRGLLDQLGGFDETFSSYGGEDWEFAYGAWNAGAGFIHAPEAVAWHNGPDAAGRDGFAEAKEVEQLELARRIPLPSVRGYGAVFAQPRTVVCLPDFAAPSLEYAIAESWLRLGDVGLWSPRVASSPLRDDPRHHVGDVPQRVRDRAQIVVEVSAPVELLDPAAFVEHVLREPLHADGVRAATVRAISRAAFEEVAVSAATDDLFLVHADARVDLESHARRRWV